jgi:hypothetical protein
MKNRMTTVTALVGFTVLLLGGCRKECCPSGLPDKSAAEATAAPANLMPGETVGTYNRTELLVAYYGSKQHAAVHQALVRQRDEALARGDKAEARRIERQGEEGQAVAHRQLAGKAPLDNVFEALKDELPAIKSELGVTRLVEDTAKLPGGVKTVDATEALKKRLPPAR